MSLTCIKVEFKARDMMLSIKNIKRGSLSKGIESAFGRGAK
jgi:hypothetical protein